MPQLPQNQHGLQPLRRCSAARDVGYETASDQLAAHEIPGRRPQFHSGHQRILRSVSRLHRLLNQIRPPMFHVEQCGNAARTRKCSTWNKRRSAQNGPRSNPVQRDSGAYFLARIPGSFPPISHFQAISAPRAPHALIPFVLQRLARIRLPQRKTLSTDAPRCPQPISGPGQRAFQYSGMPWARFSAL